MFYVSQAKCPHCPHTHDVYVEHPTVPELHDVFCYVCPVTGQSVTDQLKVYTSVDIIPAGEIVALQV
jgi:hypothetical protein